MSENYFFRPQLNSSGEPVCYTPNDNNPQFKGRNHLFDMNKFRRFMNNTDNFIKNRFTIDLSTSPENWNVNECKNLAQQNNSNFFLVGGFSNNVNNASYDCYILQPDAITNNNYNKVIQHLISPINNFINLIFSTASIDVGTNSNCIRISSETNNSLNNIFAKNDTFVLYKADFIKNSAVDLTQLKPPSEFINKKNDYEQNYETSVSTYIEQIRQAIQGWWDNRSQQIIEAINPEVQKFVNYYNRMNNLSLELSDNLAKLRLILNSYIVYLDNFEENLEKKKQILKKLKSSGNGNNGRLEDNFTLIRTKHIEISILVIIIITTLIFSLKKK